MSYSTIIFDLDGTLLNTLQDLKNALNFAMNKMGYPERTLNEVRNFVGNGISLLVKRAVPEGTSENDFQKALDIFMGYYSEHLSDCTRPYEGVTELAEKLKIQGKKLAIISNKTDDAAQDVVNHFFGGLFQLVVGKRDDLPSKPAPDSVYYVMEKLNCEKSDCIYIGDSEVDVQTAHNADLPCIGVTWGYRDRDVFVSHNAEYIADTTDEILTIINGG